MASETLVPGNYPEILKKPFDFINWVNKIRENIVDPTAQSKLLGQSLLDQWPEIDSRILVAPLIWVPPIKNISRYMEKTVKISDGVFLTEPPCNKGARVVKMSFGDNPLIPSFKNIGKHSIKMVFEADSNATNTTRNLTTVSIWDKFVDLTPEGKAGLKHIGLQIKVSPTFDVQELKTNVGF